MNSGRAAAYQEEPTEGTGSERSAVEEKYLGEPEPAPRSGRRSEQRVTATEERQGPGNQEHDRDDCCQDGRSEHRQPAGRSRENGAGQEAQADQRYDEEKGSGHRRHQRRDDSQNKRRRHDPSDRYDRERDVLGDSRQPGKDPGRGSEGEESAPMALRQGVVRERHHRVRHQARDLGSTGPPPPGGPVGADRTYEQWPEHDHVLEHTDSPDQEGRSDTEEAHGWAARRRRAESSRLPGRPP